MIRPFKLKLQPISRPFDTGSDIVFQIKILSALSVGDIRQYDLLPLAFSKSLSEKL